MFRYSMFAAAALAAVALAVVIGRCGAPIGF